MTRQQRPRHRRRTVAVSCAVLVGVALFLLGLDLVDMGLLVLVSFYAYWVLKMD